MRCRPGVQRDRGLGSLAEREREKRVWAQRFLSADGGGGAERGNVQRTDSSKRGGASGHAGSWSGHAPTRTGRPRRGSESAHVGSVSGPRGSMRRMLLNQVGDALGDTLGDTIGDTIGYTIDDSKGCI
eukprot:256543-Rhodomonas_salina.2